MTKTASLALRSLIMLIAAALTLVGGVFAMHLPTAEAAARVTVSPQPSASGPTTVTLSGSGFQYQPNAPGGVYVFFGAVVDPAGGSWAPSRGGKSGQTFAYAGTSRSQLLVAFQGGSSASVADGVIGPDGSWTAQMNIPGPTFNATFGNPHAGQAQQGATIDCRQVQCGIITIGAHGMWNANNESFSPISFGSAPQQQLNPQAIVNQQPAAPGGGQQAAPGADPSVEAQDPVELPGSDESDDPDADESDGAEPSESAEPSEGAREPDDSSGASAVAVAEDSSSNSSMSWLMYTVFGIGLIALIGAVIYALTSSRRAKTSVTE